MTSEDPISDAVRSIVEEVSRPLTPDDGFHFAMRLMREVAERAADRFSSAVRPIWGLDGHGRPTPRGSCVLLHVDGERFILTAAHVADFAERSPLHLGLDGICPLTQPFETTILPEGGRNQDVMDFAIMRFPPELLARLGSATFIDEGSIGIGGPVEERTFTCLGYPNKKSRPVFSDPGWVKGAMMSYTGGGRPASAFPARATDGVHVLVHRNPKRARDPEGRRIGAFAPSGMSGGAMIDVGALASPAGMLGLHPPRLAAIATEALPSKMIIGTRVDAILRGLRVQGWL